MAASLKTRSLLKRRRRRTFPPGIALLFKGLRGLIALADKYCRLQTLRMLVSGVLKKPDWNSGSLSLRIASYRRRRFGVVLCACLRSLSIAALGRASSSALEAVEELRRLVRMRTSRMLIRTIPSIIGPIASPCAASAPTVDVGTALSVAFQRVHAVRAASMMRSPAVIPLSKSMERRASR
jgi:hypothetical protein